MLSIGDISNLFVVLDYVYRGYRSFVTIARFWGRSSLCIPDVDMRIDRHEVKCKFMNPRALVFSCITSSYTLISMLTIFFGVFTFYLCQIYVPIYDQYVDGCVAGYTNGTFITNNLYSVAYNYASEDGNELQFNGIEEYNVERTE